MSERPRLQFSDGWFAGFVLCARPTGTWDWLFWAVWWASFAFLAITLLHISIWHARRFIARKDSPHD